MTDFERLGVFYLGREFDLEASRPRDELLLYESKDLTTHAVCVGMTGSGKTGLCLALLEEAAIDGIPALCIDPKGDLGNLLLAFPELQPADFRPWIDLEAARRAGKGPDEVAAETAQKWREGLATWGQDAARIARYRHAADLAIYTPGSNAGLPISVLRSLSAPAAATLNDAAALRDRIQATVSGLLGLLGIEADPLRSREHILIANLLDRAWRAGRDLDLADLLREIQSPPMDKVGVLDLESFYPAKERFELAMLINNLLASPGFAAWREGEPLDINRLLYTPQGKPRLAILSIAHLNDAERMFFVTLLLGEVIAWMRTLSGTSSLRAIVYMDEIFGYFPPTANPPSKMPMLTLLKQARAFGVGVVLATQNPVDLDYKGLSNAGTWFLGRLQTQRDKDRVLDGLEGTAAATGGAFDRAEMDKSLSRLGNRVFLMNNVHEDKPVVFQSRWALSYLRGPLTQDQIKTLMDARRSEDGCADVAEEAPRAVDDPAKRSGEAAVSPATVPPAADTGLAKRPILPPGVPEVFLACRGAVVRGKELQMPGSTRGTEVPHYEPGQAIDYRPAVLGVAKLHYAQASLGVDHWETVSLVARADTDPDENIWDRAELSPGEPDLESQPEPKARFSELPASLARPKTYAELEASLKNWLYRTRRLKLLRAAALKATSDPGEAERDFRIRLALDLHEERDRQVEKLRARYAPKLASLEEQIRKAVQRVAREQTQASHQSMQTVISVGGSILSAMFGRKLASQGNISRAASSVRQASRAAKEHGDISQAQETVEALRKRREELETEFAAETAKIQAALDHANIPLEELELQPRKSDLVVSRVALAWRPQPGP